ncbi:MAG: metal-dependent hydrolase [Candidatus Zixiibacteriota bacterium]|nr:MAG: metal-dependent hydrolase [candidate division Zixibacteria bacterium]
MMAPTHTMLGVATLLAGSSLRPDLLPASAVTIAAAALGSLAPDIDHPSSWIGRRLRVVSIPLVGLVGHRGVTHSLLAAVGASVGLFFLLKLGQDLAWAVAFLLGYLSHLAGDWLSGGVPLLWPSPRRFRAPVAIQTGGIIEKLFALGFGSLVLYWAWHVVSAGQIGRLL